ncbi:unnamed protein product [Brassica oleracea]|uniref:SSD domain-containing protein n=2 Tax=Brassica oleracea TaxID=3712 RepID=A0A0D3BUA9_BRAOL|nr:PREDICTED: Niemann-Pick C1 protein-like [Brassica oleracea var. oleracea]VDD08134.1 unnamed protein product [Brassica oleracea]
MKIVTSLILLFLILYNILCGVEAKKSAGYCAMYDICGARTDGKVLNCPYNIPAVKPDDLFSSKIQSLCPTITGNVCCTETQFDTLRSQVQQAIPFVVGCPACLRNFLNLFCELTCSPDQSLFINVTSTAKIKNNSTVDGIEYYITDAFGEGMYESCKNVKFGSSNSLAVDFLGGGAKNFKEWFTFIGQKAGVNMPGSPYGIKFLPMPPASSGMKPMNVSSYSCSDDTLGCSCGDCPSAAACSSTSAPPAQKQRSCSIKIGSLEAKCVDFVLAILYIVLVSLFLGGGLLHRIKGKKKSSPSSSEPRGEQSSVKPDTIHAQMLHNTPQRNWAQLSTVQGYLARFYSKYGIWVARHPALVLIVSVFLVLLLCVGLIRFKVETRPDKLWVGAGSRAADEKRFFDTHLAPFYRIEQLIIATAPKSSQPEILTDDNIKLLFDIQKKVDGLRANHSGSMVSLTDICMKPLGENCATQSLLQYFKMIPKNYDEFGGVEHVKYCFEHFTSSESCLSAFKGPLDPTTALGGFSGNSYSEASAFIVTYPVDNAVDNKGNRTEKAVAWEKAFIQLAKDELLPMVRSKGLTLSFSSESSIEEELKRESTADVITIAISYLVMFAYISLTLGDTPRLNSFYITSKVLLGLSGVLLVMLSVLGSVGFFSAIGMKSTLIIMEVIPFLVLAVGVDNMCILVHAVKRQEQELPLERRVSNALMEVGPSITLASLAEILAFAVGAYIKMPAVRVFSMFAALAVLLDFILQVTAFVALIVFDFKRAEDKRVDCFPCIKRAQSSDGDDKGVGQKKPGLLTRYMKEVHAPILSHWAVKILVIAFFFGLAMAGIALATRIEPGLEQQIVLPQDSYLQDYFNNIATYLRIGPPLYFVLKNYNYSSESRHTNQLCSINKCDSNSLMNEIAKASLTPELSYIAKPAASWVDDFLVWLSPEAFGCCRKFTNGTFCPPDDQPPCCPPDQVSCGLSEVCKDCTTCFRHADLTSDRPSTIQFKEKLPWFLSALPSADCAKGGYGAYSTSVDLKGYKSGIIQASSFRTYHTPLNKQADFVNSMRAAQEFSSKVSRSLQMEIYPYSVFYMFFEQYLDIWKTALINLSIAIAAVFAVCLIITCSFWSSAIILLVIAMIIIDLLGVMAVFHIQLNALSVVNLIMSVGIAVEFCVHITHAFSISSGDRNQRMKEALGGMGASVFSGITLTKLVGVIVLGFSKSEVFVVYYFKMYLALVLLGFLHGLVFLPVFLSMFGPAPKGDKQDHRPSASSQP